MSNLFSQLGLDLKLLIAQGVNFFIVLVVLSIFVYRPLLRVLRERRGKIEAGLADAEEARRKREWAEADYASHMAKAKDEGLKLVSLAEEEAHSRGQAVEKEARLRAQAEAAELKQATEKEIRRQHEQAAAALKEQAATIAVRSVEKLFGEEFDSKRNEQLIKKFVAE